ncbi:hypothetical protein MMC13_005946 [Lambiella insularis]|nr:hypothetical protein [Lambiella insularis]
MAKKHPLEAGNNFWQDGSTQDSHQSVKLEEQQEFASDVPTNVATRFGPAAQICCEILDNPQLTADLTAHFGQDVTRAALSLGQVLRSKQPSPIPSSGASTFGVHDQRYPTAAPSQQSSHGKSPKALPEPPPIQDPSLADVPFTHRFTVWKSHRGPVNASYERLEFIGDAYVELFASRLIYPRYPDLPPGRLSQIRESLVKNDTLANFSIAYRFHDRIELPPSHAHGGNKLVTKLLGDVFEAYVAAVILSNPENGFAIVEAWLFALWTPMLPGHQKVALPHNAEAKQDLAGRIMSKGTKIEYRDHGQSMIKKEGKIWFTVAVYFTGYHWNNQFLGTGMGMNKTEAGARAATEALMTPLVVKIAAAKKEHDAKVIQEPESQAAKASIDSG